MPQTAPTLNDGTVSVRAWHPADAPHLFNAVRESLNTVGRWLPWCGEHYALADSQKWIADCAAAWAAGTAAPFAITDAATRELLGGVGISGIDLAQRSGNVGYWVRASQTRRGIATRAARLVIDYGLQVRGLKRLEIVTACDNVASQRVVEKVGGGFQGIERGRVLISGEIIKAWAYGRIG